MSKDTVRDLYAEATKETSNATRNYWLNTAYLAGYQWLYWDKSTDQPREGDRDNRVRMVVNRMAANHRTLISNLMQRELTFEVTPNGADDGSMQAARIAEDLLRALHEAHSWEDIREKSMSTILKGGTAAIALDWDSSRSDSVETVLSIAEFAVEPGARDPERARWWIKAQLLPPEEVQSMFGMSEPPAADATAGLSPLSNRLLAEHLGSDNGFQTDLTLVLTYYERPNPLNKKGEFRVEVASEVLEQGDWPFPWDDRLNLVVGVETVQENRWFGETIYNQARSPQVAFNSAWSNLIEHLRNVSTTRLLVPHSALRFMDQATDLPGEMIPYPDGIQPPNYMEAAQLPGWLRQLPDQLKVEIDDIMGVHDVSRGMAPANLESGTALSILAEKDSSPVGRLIKVTAGMWSRLSQMILKLQEAQVKDSRFALIDTDAGPLALTWTGKDIAGQTQSKVPLEGIIPVSRAAQQQMAMKMLEMQIITDLPTYARVAQLPNERDMVQATFPDVAKARRENSRMINGEIQIPAVFDDHKMHIKEHNDMRKTPAYENADTETQMAFDEHVQGHETMSAEEAATMEQRAQASPVLGGVPSAIGSPNVEIPPELAAAAAAPEGPPLPPEGEEAMMPPMDPMAMLAELEGQL